MNNIANRNRYNLVDPFFDDFFNDERNQIWSNDENRYY